jgi:hypothetical protein
MNNMAEVDFPQKQKLFYYEMLRLKNVAIWRVQFSFMRNFNLYDGGKIYIYSKGMKKMVLR